MAPLTTSAPASAEHEPGQPAATGVSGLGRIRVLSSAALVPLLAGYATVAALLALITAMATKGEFSLSVALAGAGPGWLAMHVVPISLGGQPWGMFPLLPAIGACWLIARTSRRAAQRLGYHQPGQATTVIATIAGAHAVLGAVISLASAGQWASADPLSAFLVPGVFAAISASLGLMRQCGLFAAARDRLDPLAVHGLRAGALGMAALLVAGAVIFVLSTAFSVSRVAEMFDAQAPGFGSGLGLCLLSIGYVPNAVIASVSFGVGSGFSLGAVQVGPFDFSGGPVPGLPVLAGIPEQYASWWPVLCVLPAAVGVLVGWSVRRIEGGAVARVRVVVIAGALIGFGCVVLGTLAGGRVANGSFDPVSIPVGALSLIAFCWIAVPGALVAWFAAPHPPLRALLGSVTPKPVSDWATESEPGSADMGAGEEPGDTGDTVEDGDPVDKMVDEASVEEASADTDEETNVLEDSEQSTDADSVVEPAEPENAEDMATVWEDGKAEPTAEEDAEHSVDPSDADSPDEQPGSAR